jgi:hypothetical protein
MMHTPGPWEIGVGISNLGVLEVRSKKGIVAHVAGNDSAHQSGSKIKANECKANTLLIAAAPDLLEALEELLSADQMMASYQSSVEKAEAAIARATGQ